MERKQGLSTIGDAVSRLDEVTAISGTSPQARHYFTVADQVNQLVSASEADPDLVFMARTMALCSLPRSNPGNTGGVAGDHAGRLPSTGLLNGGGGPPTGLATETRAELPIVPSASDRSIGGPRGEKKKY